MTIEFMSEPLSSDIHWGPHVPIAPLSKKVQFWLNLAKTSLFSISFLVQLFLYVGVLNGHIAMPQNTEDDLEAISELARLERFCSCGHRQDTSLPMMENSSVTTSATTIMHDQDHDLYESGPNFDKIALRRNTLSSSNGSGSSNNGNNRIGRSIGRSSGGGDNTSSIANKNNNLSSTTMSIAFFENTYIALWVGKDVFWSMGTGDWESVRETRLVVALESVGLIMGFLTLVSCVLTAYVYRRNVVSLLDSCTVLLWIAANFTWMTGEFFLRFHNMEFDDGTEGNDRDTRIVSTVLFTSGIMIQFGIIAYLSTMKSRQSRIELASVSPVERMTTSESMRGGLTGGVLSAYRPQKYSKYSKLDISDGVEDEVLF